MKKMQRRHLLGWMGFGALLAFFRRVPAAACEPSPEEKQADGQVMRLRPHHFLDIVTSYGADERFEPHPYGHSLHTVASTCMG
jgi:hypothetical protein